MSPKQIKYLDYWFGIPLVFAFSCWRRFISIFTLKNVKVLNPRKIIFIKLIEQGASVLAYSAIKRATDIVEEKNVYFLVFAENKPILEIINIIPDENIFVIRNSGIFPFIWDVIKCLGKIRKNKIDTVIDMEFFSRFSAILSYVSGAKNRVGHHRYSSEMPYRGDLMTHKIQYNPFTHTSVAYQLLVESLFAEKKDHPLPKINQNDIKIELKKFVPSENEIENIKSIVSHELNKSILYPVIIINPNTSDLIPIRKWDASNFILLVQKLIAHFENNLTLIITGSATEISSGREIHDKIDSPIAINLTGKTNLKELVTLYSFADVLVTNDSGPGHFAAMTKIKDIVLFGPETPKLYGPLGENVYCIESGLSCCPCVNPFNFRFSICKNNLCMKSISVERVFDKVIEVLSKEADNKVSNNIN